MNARLASIVVPFLALACRAAPADPVAPASPVYTIEGAVTHAGVQRWREDITVLEAVLWCGLHDGADLSRVELVRPASGKRGPLRLQLDLAVAMEHGDSTYNVLVHPGDMLRVPSR